MLPPLFLAGAWDRPRAERFAEGGGNAAVALMLRTVGE
jgi:hypothetical protein